MDANRREFLAAAGVTALAGARSVTRQDRFRSLRRAAPPGGPSSRPSASR